MGHSGADGFFCIVHKGVEWGNGRAVELASSLYCLIMHQHLAYAVGIHSGTRKECLLKNPPALPGQMSIQKQWQLPATAVRTIPRTVNHDQQTSLDLIAALPYTQLSSVGIADLNIQSSVAAGGGAVI